MRALKPLSETLNRAVLALAARHWSGGWVAVEKDTQPDVETWMARATVPEDFALFADQRFPVYAGASDRTIFGDPKVNHAFRAWHDAWHLKLRAPFTRDGEIAVLEAQDRDLSAWFVREGLRVTENEVLHGTLLLRAEVLGQLAHQERHGAFPENQRAFVRAYVKNPARALARRW